MGPTQTRQRWIFGKIDYGKTTVSGFWQAQKTFASLKWKPLNQESVGFNKNIQGEQTRYALLVPLEKSQFKRIW